MTVAVYAFVRILPLLVLVPRVSLDSKLIDLSLCCDYVMIILCYSLILVQDQIITRVSILIIVSKLVALGCFRAESRGTASERAANVVSADGLDIVVLHDRLRFCWLGRSC